MFTSNSYLMEKAMIQCQAGQGNDRALKAAQAMRFYRQALLRGRLGKLVEVLFGWKRSLDDLSRYTLGGKIAGQSYAGIQTISIDQIRGSESRCKDFDRSFNLRSTHNKERWLNVAQARLDCAGLPPIEVIQVGDSYYVRDGHHRISVARSFGEEAIEAEVTTWKVNSPTPAPQPEPAKGPLAWGLRRLGVL